MKNWKKATLDELVIFKSGGTPDKGNPEYWGSDFPWVSAKDLKWPILINSHDKLSLKGKALAKIAPKNALLILIRGMTLFKDVPICLAGVPMAFNQDIKALVPSNEIDPIFLMYVMRQQKTHLLQLVDSAGHGTGRIDTDILKKFSIYFPPLPEQQKIAEILATWDEGIEKLERLVEAKEGILKTLYQKTLFSSHSTKNWSEVFLRNLMIPRNEQAIPSQEAPLYSLTIEDGVTPKTDRYNREFLVRDKGTKKYQLVCDGDIVFNPSNLRWGAIARAKISHRVTVSPIYEVLQIKSDVVCPEFLALFLTSPQQISIFASKVEGTLVERMAVKLDGFLATKIRIPKDKKDQEKIANIFTSSIMEMEIIKRKISLLKIQKQALMQKLLSGEWNTKGV
jgi:type I restriction enzyme S subunit